MLMADPMLRLHIGERSCQLRLLVDRAPVVCQALLGMVPVESYLVQAKFAGDELYFMVPGVWPTENPVSRLSPGDVVYARDRQTICLFYGPNIVPFGSYGSIFAKVTTGLEHLQAVGPEIWRQGPAPVRLVAEGER